MSNEFDESGIIEEAIIGQAAPDFKATAGTLVVGSTPLFSNVAGGNYELSGFSGQANPSPQSIFFAVGTSGAGSVGI